MEKAPLPPASQPFPPSASPLPANTSASGVAIASLILGIASILLCCCCWGIPSVVCGLVAIVLGYTEKRSPQANAATRSIAKIGFILGIIGMVLMLLATLFSLLFLSASIFEEIRKGNFRAPR